jgi:hypothetical protein
LDFEKASKASNSRVASFPVSNFGSGKASKKRWRLPLLRPPRYSALSLHEYSCTLPRRASR